jgi:capsular exopolysaccharide synthesis family protein
MNAHRNAIVGQPIGGPEGGMLPAIRGTWGAGDVPPLLGLPDYAVPLRDQLRVLLRHRRIVISCLAAAVLAAVAVTALVTPAYRATTVLEIRPRAVDATAEAQAASAVELKREFLRTQYQVLESRNLAGRVIDRLDLAADPSFNPPGERGWVDAAGEAVRAALGHGVPMAANAPAHVRDRLVRRLLDAVQVRPRPQSYLVEVSVTSPSPELAQRVATAMAEEFVTLSVEQRLEGAKTGRAAIERRLRETREALARAERELESRSRERGGTDIRETERTAHKRLGDLSDAMTAAQEKRMRAQALVRQVERGEFARVSALVNHPVMAELLQQLAKEEGELQHLSRTFTAAHPRMQRLETTIAGLRRRIEDETKRLSETLRADYEAARTTERLLQGTLAAQQKAVGDVNRRAADLRILERQIATDREAYKGLLERLQEIEVGVGMGASGVSVLDEAQLPMDPHRPRPLLNLVIALVAGLGAGIGAAFFQEHLDRGLKTPEDVERHLHLGTLGGVPSLRPRRGPGPWTATIPELIAAQSPKSTGAEAIRALRAALFLTTAAGPPQRLCILSARPQEGKTCVAANLAIVLAQMGKRVVLVDAAFRRPRLHRLFGREIGPGLTSFLTGNAALPTVITPAAPDKVPTLDVVVSGPVPPNPMELLQSIEMHAFFEELGRRYDFVIADGPALVGPADAVLLAREMSSVLLVVKAGETPRKLARQATDYIARLGARVLGVVLNQADVSVRGYFYSYTAPVRQPPRARRAPKTDGSGLLGASAAPRAGTGAPADGAGSLDPVASA